MGAGYYKYDSFTGVGSTTYTIIDDVVVVGTPTIEYPDGEQWSVGLQGDYDAFAFGVTYTKLNSDQDGFGQTDADNLLIGASYTFDAWSVGAFYGKVLSATSDNTSDLFEEYDGSDAYGLTAQYDLGGGASINGGVAKTYVVPAAGFDTATVADFGIKMAF